jgi:hypothetical protein
MFVEQLKNKHRTKIGSMITTLDQRQTANGAVSTDVSIADRLANDNDLPLAPMNTGILGTTRVNTATGPVAIEELTIGQMIVTSSKKLARLSYILPAEAPRTVLRIRAPYFGANQDFVIANDQYLEIQSDIAEYMFGETRVFVPAWVFKDNSKVLHHELGKTDRMYQLQLDATDGFGVGDCNVAPYLSGPKTSGKRFLCDSEARAFATERRIGQYN